jgi:type VI secretion system protein VasD
MLASSRDRHMGPKWLGCALLASIVGGCRHAPEAAPPCQDPEPLRLVLRGSERLNPGDKGEPLATVVRVYQLKGSGKIADAGFEELLDNDKTVLGDDLLGMQELTLHPSERLDPAVPRTDGAQYLAVVGLFRQPAGTSWRVLYHLPTPDPQHCHRKSAAVVQMVLEENRVELR